MCCFTFATYIILINGAPYDFFHVEYGLRQGCPLSPLLFLLIMEGLRRLITKPCAEGSLGGVNMSDVSYISHLFFVNDVLNFLDGCIYDCTYFKNILPLFCKATCMETNYNNYTMPYNIFILSGTKWRPDSNTLDSGSSQIVIVFQTGHGL